MIRLTETAAAITTKSRTGRIVSMGLDVAVCRWREAKARSKTK
jgi:hypothetical protein